MAIWDIDLTTRAGARDATQTAATACAVLILLFGYVLFRVSRIVDLSTVPLLIFLFIGFVLGTAALAAVRFRADKGAWAGIAMLIALMLLVGVSIETCIRLADGFSMFIAIPVIASCSVVGLLVFNGIRGARALSRTLRFVDDATAVFE
jgi:hypothetical protein